MKTEDQKPNITQAALRLNPELFTVLERLRAEEDRSMANMISVLLKTHPRVQPDLEREAAQAETV